MTTTARSEAYTRRIVGVERSSGRWFRSSIPTWWRRKSRRTTPAFAAPLPVIPLAHSQRHHLPSWVPSNLPRVSAAENQTGTVRQVGFWFLPDWSLQSPAYGWQRFIRE